METALTKRVAECLRGWKLELDASADPPPLSKNHLWMCQDAAGRRVLVKASAHPGDTGIGVEGRILSRSDWLNRPTAIAARLAGFDEPAQVLAVEWISGSQTLQSLHRETRRFDPQVGTSLGKTLRALHDRSRQNAAALAGLPHSEIAERFIASFCHTSTTIYAFESPQALQLIGAVQGSPGALDALEALLEPAPEPCLIHGDLRQANVLRVERTDGFDLVLVDWEMAAWGDPARDLGSVLGELALECLDPRTGFGTFAQSGALELARSLRAAYGPTERDPTLWTRCIQHAGEALLRSARSLTHDFARFDELVLHVTRWALGFLCEPVKHQSELLGTT